MRPATMTMGALLTASADVRSTACFFHRTHRGAHHGYEPSGPARDRRSERVDATAGPDVLIRVNRTASAAGAKGGLDLVEVLAAVLAAARVDRAVGVARPQPIHGQLRHAGVRLLSDPQRELRGVPRPDRVDQRTGRIVEP